jgi:hypothetical protein
VAGGRDAFGSLLMPGTASAASLSERPTTQSGSRLPVLAMTCGYSRVTGAVMIPSRRGGDILAGMWAILSVWGACPRTLVWDREAAIGGTSKATVEAASFAGTLGVRLRLAPPRDPEFKGLVERRNGFFETAFLPGRTFTSPGDVTAQIGQWLPARAATRRLRLLGGDRPIDRARCFLGVSVCGRPEISTTLALTWTRRRSRSRSRTRRDAIDHERLLDGCRCRRRAGVARTLSTIYLHHLDVLFRRFSSAIHCASDGALARKRPHGRRETFPTAPWSAAAPWP